jgi:hypothetical protein
MGGVESRAKRDAYGTVGQISNIRGFPSGAPYAPFLPFSFPKLAKRFGNAPCSLETLFPCHPQAISPAHRATWRLKEGSGNVRPSGPDPTATFPKRCVNFGNESVLLTSRRPALSPYYALLHRQPSKVS